LKAITRVFFLDDSGQKFFGEGPYRLLCQIEEIGSVRGAAQQMGMSYTKALRLLSNAERALGVPLTTKTIGGKDGGGSMLTADGKAWMKKYESYRDACVQANEKLYLEFFSGQR